MPSPSLVQADKKSDDPAAAAWEQLQQMQVGPVQDVRPVTDAPGAQHLEFRDLNTDFFLYPAPLRGGTRSCSG